MAGKRVGNSNRGRMAVPLTKNEILEAQKHTKSNAEAARYLGVSGERYKRYAKIYGIYDQHANPRGVGVAKGYAVKPNSIPLEEVFENKHPYYNMSKLKYRMIARHLLVEECSLCGYCERRLTDGKVPLVLTFKDGKRDFTVSNLHLLCYNCTFITYNVPIVTRAGMIRKSFEAIEDPSAVPKHWRHNEPTAGDEYDRGESADSGEEDYSEKQAEWLRDIDR